MVKNKTRLVKIIFAVGLCAILLVAIIPYVATYMRTQKYANIDTMYDYPYYSLSNLVDESSYIVEGKVVKVKERVTHKTTVRYKDENGKRRKSTDYMNVTPIKLEVKQVIKGKVRTKTLTCYKEFSLTENQNALPSGPVIKEGMEFILFLDKDRLWLAGGQGVSLVFGDKVSAESLYEHLDAPESIFESMVVDKEYYISVIRSIMNDKEVNKSSEIVGNMIFYFEPIEEAPYVDENEIWNVWCQGKDLNQEKGDKLRAILDSVDEWHDDNLLDRLTFYYDGHFEFMDSETKYYISYENNIIFYDHYFGSISEEDMEYIKALNKR